MQADPGVRPAPPLPPPPGRRFHMVLPATPPAVRRTVQDAARHCARAMNGAAAPGVVELVLAELMNNIVEHALAGQGDGVIELELTAFPGHAECRLRDDGAPMPAVRLPGPEAGPGPPETLPEGGFGLPLVRRLTRDLAYARADGLNCLSFTVPALADGAERHAKG